MKTYTTLNGHTLVLSGLDSEERTLLNRLRDAATTMDRVSFNNYWRPEVAKYYLPKGLSRQEITETPVYKVIRDVHSRMLVDAGEARAPDYRDELGRIVSQRFPTRRAFCEATGLSEDMLSHVLAGRKHLAIDTLSEALAKVGYRINIVPVKASK
jgi:hypothetical protein